MRLPPICSRENARPDKQRPPAHPRPPAQRASDRFIPVEPPAPDLFPRKCEPPGGAHGQPADAPSQRRPPPSRNGCYNESLASSTLVMLARAAAACYRAPLEPHVGRRSRARRSRRTTHPRGREPHVSFTEARRHRACRRYGRGIFEALLGQRRSPEFAVPRVLTCTMTVQQDLGRRPAGL